MLRARALQDRGHPFVCALCRQKLSANSRSQLDRAISTSTASTKTPNPTRIQAVTCQSPSRWNTRSLSTTAHLNTSNGNPGPGSGPGPGPPKSGAFPGAFSGAGGSWGAFATGINRPSSNPPISDGLLPHEREARLRSAAAPAPAPPPPPAQSTKPAEPTRFSQRGQRGVTQGDGHRRRPNEAQATLSRSVLADVFKTNREPLPPPTPKSWSTGNQEPEKTRTATGLPLFTFENLGSSSSSPGPSSSIGADGKDKELPRNSHASRHKGTGWGSFSHRKPETSHHGLESYKHGNESTVWSEITKAKRTKAKPLHGTRSHSPDRAGATSKAHQNEGNARQDFWGELETRATTLKDRHKRGTKLLKESVLKVRKPEAEAQLLKPRRNSRFEMDQEEAEFGDRRTKKSKPKNAQKNRRMANDEDWDDETVHRWEQKQRRKAEKDAMKRRAAEEEQPAVPIFLPEYISASNLSRALKQKVDSFLKDMEEMGFENVTSDTIFTGETAALIAMEYGFEPTVDSGSVRDLRPRPVPEDVTSLPSRPPVVTIMGHVDHGKTTLLDWLRKSSVAAQEHGGITQHIGAFIVNMSSGKSITFLDTPGHAAFLSMRQRGANVTDIVVLVVAADDSIMPQTLEALKHATSAKVPIIVAINKIDKEDAKVDQVKADLARHGVEIEDFGGDVQVVCVSGKTGQGMEDLEENIVTLSEILDVRAEYDGMAEGWILESSIKPQGKAATVLVKRGTLRPGDFIAAGKTWARIRVLRNEAGQEIDEAPPGTPVEILGWRELPSAGERVLQSPDEGKAKTAVEYRLEMAEREQSSIQLAEQEQRLRDKAAAEAAAEEDPEAATVPTESGVILQNFTVKADVVGSVEAVCGTILELGNNEVQPKILRSSAGPITEYDVDHAATSKSVIVNFNCPIQPHIKQRAEEAKVQILDHNVIYHVVDDVKATLSKLLPMNVTIRVTGEADVLQVFPINVKRRTFQNIAGCRVRNGSIKKSSRVRIMRRGEVIFEGSIDTLKHVKKDVQEMGKGTECGIGLEGFDDLQTDDQIQTYEEVKAKRYL
ncbi:Translation initiation factor IF-2 [Cladobotryum mycophilum]|uniref:Translation initiation factor IF-2, mitochondrial n=1 Tax=Cladobotryum mycophilum TaxID=491253 RepID=A0ABR0SUA4_9HYPO